MSRLYIAEPRISPTGSLADHRVAVRPSEIAAVGAALLAAVRGQGDAARGLPLRTRRWVNAAAAELRANPRRGLVVVGDRQPPAVHAFAHAINIAIGAAGSTLAYTPPPIIEPLGDGLEQLATALRARLVKVLVIVEANPAYTAPYVDMARLLRDVPETICVSLEQHETSRACRSFLPLSHYMETWGDARAYDGTISLIQPLIRPMYETISVHELLAVFAGDPTPSVHRMLRERYAGAAQATSWQQVLKLGLVPGSAFSPVEVTADLAAVGRAAVPPAGAAFEVAFDASTVYDGRFASNAWLQELPTPLEKMTWGNAAIVAPATAKRLGVTHEAIAQLRAGNVTVELPVYVMPGHAEGCATVELGFGRAVGGAVAEGIGVDVYPLRTSGFVTGASLMPTGRTRAIASTQTHFDQLGRPIALTATLAHYRAHPDFTEAQRGPLASWLPDFADEPAWGMTIDTAICTGCSSCVIACQAENNIPVVGREGVLRNREMHWLRIDTYREARGDDVAVVHQPMLCQHCEKAPCEYVCPTYATQHSPDGLNEMIYNRCIGTRFCSNNCPYKVRRFNWFDYTEDTPRTLQLQRNPNVTVRARGVMEKCTFCVQRIRGAEIEARKENRALRPNEVVTACQQACPTGAIQFGLLSHAGTNVVEWRKQPRHYAVLHDLGTRPRTLYLAKITNPHPELGDDE